MVFAVVAGIFDKSLVQGSPGSASVHGISDQRFEYGRQVTQASARTSRPGLIEPRVGGRARIGRVAT
jgi:hypothetical protein